MNVSGKKVLSPPQVKAAVAAITQAIFKKSPSSKNWAFVGIQRRGVPLARRLVRGLEELGVPGVSVGSLDITFYRDDMAEAGLHPIVHDTDLPFDLNDKTIILVDDVLYTGRTIRSALDQIMDFGRPRRVYLAALIDRGHRELPISADFIGETLSVLPSERVEVHLDEVDGEDAVWVNPAKREREAV